VPTCVGFEILGEIAAPVFSSLAHIWFFAVATGRPKPTRHVDSGFEEERCVARGKGVERICRANGFRELYRWLVEQRDVLLVRAGRRKPIVCLLWDFALETARRLEIGQGRGIIFRSSFRL
jgi:hypothetical protein